VEVEFEEVTVSLWKVLLAWKLERSQGRQTLVDSRTRVEPRALEVAR
jgi:hypothetical protein